MTDNKVPAVWITGASSGIGKAAAKQFARVGVKVFASSRRLSELERVNTELSEENLHVEILPCNVASSANVEQAAKKILAENQIVCLINNAGITSFKTAIDNSNQEVTDIINTNLLGAIYSIQSVLPSMIKNGGGKIINILSVVTHKIFLNSSAYSASKMGMLGFTNVLREEVRKDNIKIINIIPGATETPIWSSEMRKKYSNRMMKPDEIASLLVWIYLNNENMVTEEIVIRPVEGDLS